MGDEIRADFGNAMKEIYRRAKVEAGSSVALRLSTWD
jgi:hypothetical protein